MYDTSAMLFVRIFPLTLDPLSSDPAQAAEEVACGGRRAEGGGWDGGGSGQAGGGGILGGQGGTSGWQGAAGLSCMQGE